MPELTYQAATLEDAPAIFRLCKDLIDTYENKNLIDYDRVLAWVREKISANISSYTSVYEAGQKVAYYCLCRQDDQWELDDLYVLPQFQNRGIGSQILKKCVNEINAPIYLYVFSKNLGAIRLYERYGFSAVQKVSETRQIMRREG